MALLFEDPPSKPRLAAPPGHHAKVAAELKEHPGEWARIGLYGSPSSAAAMAQGIRKGQLAAYRPAGAFEAVSRTVKNEYRVYARFTGEAKNA